MKPSTLVILCLFGVLIIYTGQSVAQYNYNYYNHYDVDVGGNNRLCDPGYCTSDCFDEGLHGECGSDDICRCTDCIYRGCRRYCLKTGQTGQCDGAKCNCLE